MRKPTATLAALLLAVGAFGADPPTDAPKKTETKLLYERLVEANTKATEVAYAAYVKALEAANVKILAGLEASIKDFNDTKKFPKLDIATRAKMIEELKEKAAEVKKGSVGEAIVARRSGSGDDLLGDGPGDAGKAIVGKWKRADGYVYVFNIDGTGNLSNGWQFKWVSKDNGVFELVYTSSGAVTFVTLKGKSATFTMETGTILAFDKISN